MPFAMICPLIAIECYREYIETISTEDITRIGVLASALQDAFWHYLDDHFAKDSSLTSPSFHDFAVQLLHYLPKRATLPGPRELVCLVESHLETAPLAGIAVLNPDMSKVVMVRGYGSDGKWGFPKGKKEEGETDVQCAVREVKEETGLTLQQNILSKSFRMKGNIGKREFTLFVVVGIPETTALAPNTVKEISDVRFIPVRNLPFSERSRGPLRAHMESWRNRHNVPKDSRPEYFSAAVLPFCRKLRDWIQNQPCRSPSPEEIVHWKRLGRQ